MVGIALKFSLLALSCIVIWRTGEMALADSLAHDGSAADFRRAVDMEPGDESLLAGQAIFQSEEGGHSIAIDTTLRHALAMNPLDAPAWITLGLRAESRGEAAEAERDLERAADVDRTFKPAWTLANYYFRAHQPEKFRCAISRCLSLIQPKDLQPMGFDPTPVFDLCWRQSDRSKEILHLIPRREETLVPYLKYLYKTNRTEAALEAWPEVIRVASHVRAADADALIGFDEYLIGANRIPEAIAVWNELAKRKIVRTGALDIGRGFAWHVQPQPGVFVTEYPEAIQFEFTGDEPENCELLWRILPVTPETQWRLAWRIDPRTGADPGLQFEVGPAKCPLLRGNCQFITGAAMQSVRLSLQYVRSLGTTRPRGILMLSRVRLDPNP